MSQFALMTIGATALLATSAQVSAQASVREACMPDIRNLCAAELSTFDRAKIRACLIANIKKTSPACQAAAKAQQDAVRAKQITNGLIDR